jgi:DNA adenine methylase
MQYALFDAAESYRTTVSAKPFKKQLLKWIGNKQRFAHEIISFFPKPIGTYFEPFIGAGGVLATLAPDRAVASDNFQPLMEIWEALKHEPEKLKQWYANRWHMMARGDKQDVYERIKASYNRSPNGADLLFLCRSCYGGVVRFRKDGYMSTPLGPHDPITPMSFSERVNTWHLRVQGTDFRRLEYEQAMAMARPGDLIYCDPPYSHSQAILYGAQNFNLVHLLHVIRECKARGVYVVLSIDGTKKSGDIYCSLPLPSNLFEREIMVNCGRSMLRRFQREGDVLHDEVVRDRLLLTY